MISSKFWLVIILLTVSTYNVAQVGIGTTNPKAVLDINSASSGILMPRLTTKERLAIENPAQALTVYDIDLGCFTFWHNNQWHCLCGENDVLSPDEDIDDDDDGIRDTDEIANCIANGEDVIFTINEATVPDNPTRTSNGNIDESTGTKYTTITGNYFTSCGVGTWSFKKIENTNDNSVFNNNMDDRYEITTPTAGLVNSDKKLYFHFKRNNNSAAYAIRGEFSFNGPPIQPIFTANTNVVQANGNTGAQFRYAFNEIWFDWEGNENAIIADPDNQTNKNNGKQISQNERININDNSGGDDPRIRSLTWEVELPEVSNFSIYTDKTGISEEGIALRAIATSSTNYSFSDNDGIVSSLDIDSDNDGIYDVVEAGFIAYDTNGDGILNSSDDGYLDTNNNGMHDTLESLTPKDTNSNGVLDAYELDADSDTCLDVYEAGFTDLDNDGDLDGTGIDNSNGKVTGNTDGYTDPGTTYQNINRCAVDDGCEIWVEDSKFESFNGKNKYLEIEYESADANNTINPVHPWSLAISFYPEKNNNNQNHILGASGQNGGLYLYLHNKKLHLKIGGLNNQAIWTGPDKFDKNTWYSVAVCFSGGGFGSNLPSKFKIFLIENNDIKEITSEGAWNKSTSDANEDVGLVFGRTQFKNSYEFYKGKISQSSLTSMDLSSISLNDLKTFIINPMCWLDRYANGNLYNSKNGTYNFIKNITGINSNGSNAASYNQIYLMGDGNNDKPNLIRNEVSPLFEDTNWSTNIIKN